MQHQQKQSDFEDFESRCQRQSYLIQESDSPIPEHPYDNPCRDQLWQQRCCQSDSDKQEKGRESIQEHEEKKSDHQEIRSSEDLYSVLTLSPSSDQRPNLEQTRLPENQALMQHDSSTHPENDSRLGARILRRGIKKRPPCKGTKGLTPILWRHLKLKLLQKCLSGSKIYEETIKMKVFSFKKFRNLALDQLVFPVLNSFFQNKEELRRIFQTSRNKKATLKDWWYWMSRFEEILFEVAQGTKKLTSGRRIIK